MKKLLVLLLLLIACRSDAAFHGSPPQHPELALGQINLGGGGFSYWETNGFLRASNNWINQSGGLFPLPTDLDANGFPYYNAGAGAHSGWLMQSISFPMQYSKSQNFVVSWSGQGDVQTRPGGVISGNNIACSAANTGGGGLPECDNTVCTPGTGYISGTTFHSVTNPTGTGNCATFSVGQPISGGYSDVSSGTYNSGTGAVSLTLANTIGAQVGDIISLQGLYGSGEIYQLNGQFTATSGTTGTTLNFTGPTGLTLTIGGGVAEGSAVSHYGVPTIINGAKVVGPSGNCLAGENCYSVNFSQTYGSVGTPNTIYPGGMQEFSITGEQQFYNTWSSGLGLRLVSTGTAGLQFNHARHIAFVRTDDTRSPTTDDLINYLNGNVVSVDYKTFAGSNGKTGLYRDLGTTAYPVHGNCTTWNTFKVPTYGTQHGVELKKNLYGGTTTHTAGVTTASFTGQFGGSFTITGASGTTLSIGSVNGYLMPGDLIVGGGAASGKTVLRQINGTPGGTGDYKMSASVAGASGSPTFNSEFLYVSAMTSGALTPGAYIPTSIGLTGNLNYLRPLGPWVFCPYCTGTSSGQTGTYQLGNNGVQHNIAATAITISSDEYKVNFLPGPPQDKDTVIVTFDATTADRTTLLFSADNGNTYSPVVDSGGGANMVSQNPVSGSMVTLVYSADIGAWLSWRTNSGEPNGMDCGTSPEFFLKAVSELNALPMITEGAMSAVPRTDFVTQYGLMKQRLFPSITYMKFETVDETWNAGSNNIQSLYLQNLTYAYSQKGYQVATVNADSTATNVLHFGAGNIPSWVVPGAGVAVLTTGGSILPNSRVGTLNSPAAGDITLVNSGTVSANFVNGITAGDLIGFSWMAAAGPGQPNAGARLHEMTGKEASTLGQAASAVFGGDTSKYRVMLGVDTNGDALGTIDEIPRAVASAFVGEDNSKIPLQSGCVGRDAIQTGCPTFVREPSYLVVQELSVQTYVNGGVLNFVDVGLGSTLFRIDGGYLNENAWAWCYLKEAAGCASHTTLLSNFLNTMYNQYEGDSISNFNNFIWLNWYNQGRNCWLQQSQPSCPIKGIGSYEGGYSATSTTSDAYQPVFSATNGTSCQLNTTWPITGFINNNGNSGSTTPGNIVSITGVLSGPVSGNAFNVIIDWTHPQKYYGPTPQGAQLLGVTGTPIVLGGGQTNSSGTPTGFNPYAATLFLDSNQFQPPGTSMTLASNGAFAGMEVQLVNISDNAGVGTHWTTLEGQHFLVGSTGLTQAAVPLKNLDGTDFDCSGFNTLTQLKLVYVDSSTYITYFRLSGYTAAQLETNTTDYYGKFFAYGGNGASIINAADWQSADSNSGGTASGNDVYQYWTIGQSLPISASGTISGNTMTLTGSCTGSSLGNTSPPANFSFAVGMPIYRADNSFVGNITAGSGCAGSYTLDGTPPTISTPEALGSWTTTSGTAMKIGGVVVGRFEQGFSLTFSQSLGLNHPPLTVLSYNCGGSNAGCGSHSGDSVVLSGSAGTITAKSQINASFVGTVSDSFGNFKGAKAWNRSKGGWLFNTDLYHDNDNTPAFLAKVG